MKWRYYNKFIITSAKYPHEEIFISKIPWKDYKYALVAQWTSEFDCEEKTQYWYCIKDDIFDISKLKAKRRYEINKGNKYFYTKPIDPTEYLDELYQVYLGSLEGYQNPKIKSKERMNVFFENIKKTIVKKECILFGCFKRDNDKLCGYSDVYIRGQYLPISSFNCMQKEEKNGVNFALVYGIVNYFQEKIEKGAYLSDGARNVLHETNFQEFLIKYFEFRRAY